MGFRIYANAAFNASSTCHGHIAVPIGDCRGWVRSKISAEVYNGSLVILYVLAIPEFHHVRESVGSGRVRGVRSRLVT